MKLDLIYHIISDVLLYTRHINSKHRAERSQKIYLLSKYSNFPNLNNGSHHGKSQSHPLTRLRPIRSLSTRKLNMARLRSSHHRTRSEINTHHRAMETTISSSSASLCSPHSISYSRMIRHAKMVWQIIVEVPVYGEGTLEHWSI